MARLEEISERVTRLKATTETHAPREWVYQKALAVIVLVAGAAATGGSAVVSALMGG